jgi:DNA-binding transcriptional ArsR family regulator
MRTIAPPLLPILRSRVQAELLAALLLHPGREYSLTELAELARTPLTTVRREINRFADVGLVTERQVGRSRLVAAVADHPYVRPLTELISHSFGPLAIVGDEFSRFAPRAAVAIFGSWAARYAGVAGPTPHDVDVIVVGSVDRTEIYEAAERTEQRLHRMPVNPVSCSVERWQAEADALIQSVKTHPLIWVVGSDPLGGPRS